MREGAYQHIQKSPHNQSCMGFELMAEEVSALLNSKQNRSIPQSPLSTGKSKGLHSEPFRKHPI